MPAPPSSAPGASSKPPYGPDDRQVRPGSRQPGQRPARGELTDACASFRRALDITQAPTPDGSVGGRCQLPLGGLKKNASGQARWPYDHLVIALLESVGVTIAGAFLAAAWHILSRNGQPEPGDLGVGFDVLVAAMITQFTFIHGSHGLVAILRWWGFALLFVILMAMAVATRMHGYGRVVVYSNDTEGDLPVYHMTAKCTRVTSAMGCAVLCIFWWANVNIELVIQSWREVLH